MRRKAAIAREAEERRLLPARNDQLWNAPTPTTPGEYVEWLDALTALKRDCRRLNVDTAELPGTDERQRRYRTAHAERQREQAKRRHAANPDKVRARRRAAYRRKQAKNPERFRQNSRVARARYAARTDAEMLADRERLHPDDLKVCIRGCGESLPLSVFGANRSTADGLSRRCKPCGADATRRRKTGFALDSWDERGLYSCVYCSAPYSHADHKVPVASGGADVAENLVPACEACNLSKHARDLFDWLPPESVDHVATWPVELREVST